LINVNILTEGMDVPNVQSIFLTRPTISTILMTQMIGRGLRGPKAGGTKEAYIVSFIDEWQDKVAWVNPEKLYIEANIDFLDQDRKSKETLLRLISINKIEEFAILADKIIDKEQRRELECLQFIERFPVGVYCFKLLVSEGSDKQKVSNEKLCEVLVYDNILQSYNELAECLPSLFLRNGLNQKDILTEKELDLMANFVDANLFSGCQKHPAYFINDIKNFLQYYAINGEVPPFIKLDERENYDIDKIAQFIIESKFNRIEEKDYLNNEWKSNKVSWRTFFNFDERNFLREIDLAISRIIKPDLFKTNQEAPIDEKERRNYEDLDMWQLREENPAYEKKLRDKVFANHTDEHGYYVCAESGYKSKSKLDFHVDHIIPRHNGGKTEESNLQILCRKENYLKGAK